MSNLWNSEKVVEAWRRETVQRAQMMEKATERMLQVANVKTGGKVLDIAAGIGDQSFLASRLVGPEGSVVATDISKNMIEIASKLAKEKGLTNITALVMDAEQLDFPPYTFDSAISRHGLMFISNLAQALTGIYQVLKVGGSFAALVWSKPENNPAISIPMSIFSRLAGLQPIKSGNPGLFSLAEPEILLNALKNAGFKEVKVEFVPHVQQASSIKEFLLNRQNLASGTMSEALNRLSEDERNHARLEIVKALRQYEGPNGLNIPSESLLVYGTKRARTTRSRSI
jgi:ubiquinone/menaquinone biosynthesis C-methylase UbiE